MSILSIDLHNSKSTIQLSFHFQDVTYHRVYLGHVRPSHTGSGTSCAKHSSVGSNIASGMAAAITTSSKGTIRLSFHFQNVTYESLDDNYCSKFSTGVTPTYLDDGLNPASHPSVLTGHHYVLEIIWSVIS
jgi:hypothetical protein